ncbi:MAG: LemA family protein [Alphaproteobacteria bacterium]|nr:LemA family protein [Alphaproteobacteria bacterium]
MIALAVLAGAYLWYMAMVSRRNSALEALSGIDVQLTKRASLIPNVLKIARSFMNHERGLLNEIVELRNKVAAPYDPKDADAVAQHLDSAKQLSSRMGQFMLTVENYPELKSNETMVMAQKTYNEVELQIAAARRFYNSAVNSLNTSIQTFPGNLIASLANIEEMPFYEADAAHLQPVDADAYLPA